MEQGENQSIARMVFHEGPAPTDFKLGYEPYVFNTYAHRAVQSKDNWIEFHSLDSTTPCILSSAFFLIDNGKAKSPAKAPFGGFEIANTLQPELIFNFIEQVEKRLKQLGIQEIEILCPPELYSHHQPLLTTLLLNSGFEISEAEAGACIQVDSESLVHKMNKDKRTRLQHGIKSALSFQPVELKNLDAVYNFIEQSRTKQGRKLSMSYSDLAQTVEQLPQNFFLVAVYDTIKMIGACICVRVKSNIVYTFYSAHDSEYDTLSPQVFLLANLYDWCSRNQITLLDLGTSMVAGRPNFPLLDFKLRMGATLTPKFKFRKNLA